MGLNFRKSISLFPGVKLNLSKGGASISGGVPGLRKSINTKGQVTTTASIPGTGIYYTDKKKIGGSKKKADREKEKKTKAAKETKEAKTTKTKAVQPAVQEEAAPVQQAVPVTRTTPAYTTRPTSSYAPPYSSAAVPDLTKQVDANALKTIHKMADDTVEWEEIVNSPNPPDSSYNPQMWAYYYAAAPAVLSGDIDTYLRLIDEVNPLGDLLEYGTNFEFGTDSPDKMAVEYTVNKALLARSERTLARFAYNNLLQDFVCSLSIRIARDMFALLPVRHTVVNTVMDGQVILSIDFDRDTLSRVKFGFIDPSETVQRFPHAMQFTPDTGFYPVNTLI